MIRVKLIETKEELEIAFAIRESVFVQEQHFDSKSEFDGNDEQSHHFLAFVNGEPFGTCRWRKTDKGIKLERFAVLIEHRGKGLGKNLVQTTVAHILSQVTEKGTLLYLNANAHAVPLYEKHGFRKEGEPFEAYGIKLFRMVRYI